MSISLHFMAHADLEQIKNTLDSEFDEFWNYNVFKNELENPNSTYIVAKEDASIVGFGGVWESVDDIHITNIVTRKDKRKLGIGSLILEKLIDIAKNKDKPLTLEVNENNISAINLYKKYNFKILGKRKKYYNNLENALIMTLNPSALTGTSL